MSIAGTSSLVPEPPVIKPPEAFFVKNPPIPPIPPVTKSARLEIFFLVISWKKLVAASVRASLRDFAPLIASFNPWARLEENKRGISTPNSCL